MCRSLRRQSRPATASRSRRAEVGPPRAHPQVCRHRPACRGLAAVLAAPPKCSDRPLGRPAPVGLRHRLAALGAAARLLKAVPAGGAVAVALVALVHDALGQRQAFAAFRRARRGGKQGTASEIASTFSPSPLATATKQRHPDCRRADASMLLLAAQFRQHELCSAYDAGQLLASNIHDRGSIERDLSLCQRLTLERGAGLEDDGRCAQDGALHRSGCVQGGRPGDLPEDVLLLRSVLEGDGSACPHNQVSGHLQDPDRVCVALERQLGKANIGAPLVQPGLKGHSFDGSGAQVKLFRVHPACGVRVRGLHVADGSGHLRRSRARVACCENLSIDELGRRRVRVAGIHDESKASDGFRRDEAGAYVTSHMGRAGGGNARLGQNGKVARGAEVNNRELLQLSGRKSHGTGAVEVERQEQRAEGEHRAIEHVRMDSA
eukprot:scaffold17595_cov61-Phaeocystis_antarctica.AAC.6